MKGIDQNLEKYISDQDIAKRVKEISNEISHLYCDKNPILIGVLNGSFIFLSDLIRHLNIDCEVDFIKISSYLGKKSVGKINMTKGLDLDIKNRNVIIIEDIIDSGKSINYLYDYISNLNPKNVAVISLLAKKSISKLNFKIDFIGFEISSEFVVGYGLDYNQKLRNLKSIYKL
tara:strand:+ start:461 stop:982 length:522 start_codon:yes stop_codon:yes gene_type:complete